MSHIYIYLLLHLVGVVVLLEAVDAKVEVLADGAVVAILYVLLAGVAGVDELVLALGVEKSMIEYSKEFWYK